MVMSEIIKQVVDKKSAILIRESNQSMVKGQAFDYDVKPLYPYIENDDNVGFVLLDLFTANAMLTVYNAIKPENQPLFNSLSLNRLIKFTWDHVK